jgi:hypothetical protein
VTKEEIERFCRLAAMKIELGADFEVGDLIHVGCPVIGFGTKISYTCVDCDDVPVVVRVCSTSTDPGFTEVALLSPQQTPDDCLAPEVYSIFRRAPISVEVDLLGRLLVY